MQTIFTLNIGPYEKLESIFSKNFAFQINIPTKITGISSTLIDNILINFQENVYISGNLTTCISDHVLQFTIIENLSSDQFQISKLVSVNTKQLKHENFLFKVNNLLDKHAPFKEQAKRQETLRFKPWISQGILASIKRKDKN